MRMNLPTGATYATEHRRRRDGGKHRASAGRRPVLAPLPTAAEHAAKAALTISVGFTVAAGTVLVWLVYASAAPLG